LPPEQLEILLLTRYQKMKYAEVGELIGCSEGAVKLKVFRALQQLRSLYFKLEQL
jgi:DNA-directed RNA polymerase specialized sigma24 family protein